VEVPLRRLERWIEGFRARHGALEAHGWVLRAADGATAELLLPAWLDLAGPAHGPAGRPLGLADLVAQQPVYLALLVRRAGYAVGLFAGAELLARKVGSRHVHGRTAAGGWSQQRYARRRANQADEIAGAAADAADRILADAGMVPAFLVTGGDRPLLTAAVAAGGRALAGLSAPVHLAVGTPDRAVLEALPDRVLAVRIALVGADGTSEQPATAD
jgi:hypothetical protein